MRRSLRKRARKWVTLIVASDVGQAYLGMLDDVRMPSEICSGPIPGLFLKAGRNTEPLAAEE